MCHPPGQALDVALDALRAALPAAGSGAAGSGAARLLAAALGRRRRLPRREGHRAVADAGVGAAAGRGVAEARALHERGVDEHERGHALNERRRARQHARVVPGEGWG
eukprot:scaffold98124_cov42-Phaeocystis_antarctica.AAC.2